MSVDSENIISSIAPAKINLFLHVTGKRPDNYHLINSIFAFSEFGDKIKICESQKDELLITGEFSNQIEDSLDNLVFKTADIIREQYNIEKPIKIHLEKNIPVGAGMGGGSSDAASTAKLLRKLWNLDIADSELASLLLPIGADIPPCVHGKLSFISGIGEEIHSLALDNKLSILLVNPMIHITTADIFKMGIENYSTNIEISDIPKTEKELILWLQNKNNDLENNAIDLFPEVGNLINEISNLDNCMLARMSGSGSTCFGIFNNIDDAKNAANVIKDIYPDYWVVTSVFS